VGVVSLFGTRFSNTSTLQWIRQKKGRDVEDPRRRRDIQLGRSIEASRYAGLTVGRRTARVPGGGKVVIDDGIRSAQGAGPTKVGWCENVEVARVHPTPKSFRVEHERERNSPSDDKRLENCAAQDRSKISPARPNTPLVGGRAPNLHIFKLPTAAAACTCGGAATFMLDPSPPAPSCEACGGGGARATFGAACPDGAYRGCGVLEPRKDEGSCAVRANQSCCAQVAARLLCTSDAVCVIVYI
jgi:hypothetical protein